MIVTSLLFYPVLFISGVLVPSLSFSQGKALPSLDPDKFTICSMTINSSNERAKFEEQAKKYPDHFNPIVELTEFGEDDWFSKACESNVRCDQLVVSGHFGGMFFGSSDKVLPLDLIEKKGCSKSCEGILSHPYEVFLFGCNTLSTKEKDHRTPEQYLQVLLADGISRVQAEMVVESRYGALGDDHKSKMQRAFSGASKQIYGFKSVGPSGGNVEALLGDYFRKVNLKQHLQKLQAKRAMGKVDLTNRTLAHSLRITAFAQCPGISDENNPSTKIICGLLSEEKSVESRLALMEEALADEKYLTFIPAINQFLSQHPVSGMSAKEGASVERIASNGVIKGQIQALLTRTKSLSLLPEWIDFASNLGYISEAKGRDLLAAFVNEMFKRRLSVDEKDQICSLKKRPEIWPHSLGDLGKLDANHLKALECMRPQQKETQLRLLEGVRNADPAVAASYIRIFQAAPPQDKEVQLRLLALLKDASPSLRGSIALAFIRVKSEDKEVQLVLVQELRNPDPEVRRRIALSFTKMKVEDKEVQFKLLEGLRGGEPEIQRSIVSAFGEAPVRDPEVQLQLVDELKNGSADVRQRLAYSFVKMRPQDKNVQLKLIGELKNADPDVRLSVALSFKEMRPQSKEVQLKLLEELKNDDARVRRQLILAFEKMGIKDRLIQGRLKEVLGRMR